MGIRGSFGIKESLLRILDLLVDHADKLFYGGIGIQVFSRLFDARRETVHGASESEDEHAGEDHASDGAFGPVEFGEDVHGIWFFPGFCLINPPVVWRLGGAMFTLSQSAAALA